MDSCGDFEKNGNIFDPRTARTTVGRTIIHKTEFRFQRAEPDDTTCIRFDYKSLCVRVQYLSRKSRSGPKCFCSELNGNVLFSHESHLFPSSHYYNELYYASCRTAGAEYKHCDHSYHVLARWPTDDSARQKHAVKYKSGPGTLIRFIIIIARARVGFV